MPEVNCSSSLYWNLFRDSNPCLTAYDHLRPSGVRTYELYPPPGPRGRTLVASHSVAAAQAVIDDMNLAVGTRNVFVGPVQTGCFLARFSRTDLELTDDEKWEAIERIRKVFAGYRTRVFYVRYADADIPAHIRAFYEPERSRGFRIDCLHVPAGTTLRDVSMGLWDRLQPPEPARSFVQRRRDRRRSRRLTAILRAVEVGDLIRIDF